MRSPGARSTRFRAAPISAAPDEHAAAARDGIVLLAALAERSRDVSPMRRVAPARLGDLLERSRIDVQRLDLAQDLVLYASGVLSSRQAACGHRAGRIDSAMRSQRMTTRRVTPRSVPAFPVDGDAAAIERYAPADRRTRARHSPASLSSARGDRRDVASSAWQPHGPETLLTRDGVNLAHLRHRAQRAGGGAVAAIGRRVTTDERGQLQKPRQARVELRAVTGNVAALPPGA